MLNNRFPPGRRQDPSTGELNTTKGSTTTTTQTIIEARDGIRYGYATGWAHLLAVADRVSVLAYECGRSPDGADVVSAARRKNAHHVSDVDAEEPALLTAITDTAARTTPTVT